MDTEGHNLTPNTTGEERKEEKWGKVQGGGCTGGSGLTLDAWRSFSETVVFPWKLLKELIKQSDKWNREYVLAHGIESAGVGTVGAQATSPTGGGASRNVPSFIQQTFTRFPLHASLLLALRVLQCTRFGAGLVDAIIGKNLPLQKRRAMLRNGEERADDMIRHLDQATPEAEGPEFFNSMS